MDALLLLKASLILVLSLAAAPLLARSPAVTRHQMWTLTFCALLALPLLGLALPVLNVPVPGRLSALASLSGLIESDAAPRAPIGPKTAGAAVAPDLAQARGLASSAGPSTPSSVGGGQSNALPPAESALRLLPVMWLLGTVAAVATLLLSLLRVALLARASDVVTDPSWKEAAQELGERLGLRRPARLLTSPRVATPMAGGLWRPVIFLPASAAEWSADWRDIVLAHELAHLARRDPIRHVLARLAVGLYWFHPLAWLAARQATAARELACDEAVLGLGTRPSTYARVLIDLADSMRQTDVAVTALPMVERSLLEKRITTMLQDNALPAMRRRFWSPTIGTALLTLALATAQPIARSADNGGLAPGVDLPPASPEAPVTAAAQTATRRDTSACDWNGAGFFSGNISTGTGKQTVERVGTNLEVHAIKQTLGDLRICMVAENLGGFSGAPPSLWLANASRTVIEARRGPTVQRLEATRQAGGPQFSWQSGGIERPFDAVAQQWRDRMLETLDTLWEMSSIRGEQSSLRGEISSIRGEESSLRGEISSLGGHLSSMRGDVSSIRGEESSLRGEISSILGHVSSLRGEISSARGAISNLNADRLQGGGATSARLIADLDAQIALIEREIRDFNADAKVAEIEREIQRFDANRKVAAVEAEIRAFDVEAKVAEIERALAGLDINGRIEAIEREFVALDAGGRMLELQQQLDAEMKRLEAALSAIR